MLDVSTKMKNTEKGQSFVELLLVVIFLMIFVLGIAEFGSLLNQYLNLIDGARESARVLSDFNPDDYSGDGGNTFQEDAVLKAVDIMKPLVLDQSLGDDIIISYFSIGMDDDDNYVYTRYPSGDPDGYSYMDNQDSMFTNSEIQDLVDGTKPERGILLIEIYYNYPHLLKAPVFSAIVPDPIPVYTHVFMPLARFHP